MPMPSLASRQFACMLGNVIGDALGAPYEFRPVQLPQSALKKAKKGHLCMGASSERFLLQAGQWTDDASMGLCLAGALKDMVDKEDMLVGGGRRLDKNLLMDLFMFWWITGLNNGRGKLGSIGLGGVISSSVKHWHQLRLARRPDGEFFSAIEAKKVLPERMRDRCDGNGSIMRLGAAAAFARSHEEAMQFAYEQSIVTTPGKQSANCSRLLAYLSYCAMMSTGSDPEVRKAQLLSEDNLKKFMTLVQNQHLHTIDSDYSEVGIVPLDDQMINLCLSRGQDNEFQYLNWRADPASYQLSPRAKSNPGYYGAYVMDGMSLALHIIAHTHSFEEALTMAALMQGDADSVAAVVGQLAGAIYGIEAMPKDWVHDVNQHPLNVGSPIAVVEYLAHSCLPACGASLEECMALKQHLLSLDPVSTYYAHANSDRCHFFRAKSSGYQQTGDQLKAEILEKVRADLNELVKTRGDLNQHMLNFYNSTDFKTLKKGQGVATRLFGLETDSVKALRKMVKETSDVLTSTARVTA